MADTQQYDNFIRSRITELRMSKAVSEHRMSLDLGKKRFIYLQISSLR